MLISLRTKENYWSFTRLSIKPEYEEFYNVNQTFKNKLLFNVCPTLRRLGDGEKKMLQKLRCTYKAGVVVPRSSELLALEGWYKIGEPTQFYTEYIAASSKLKFSRWLKAKGLSDNHVAAQCKAQVEAVLSIKLSCRYRDILRMSETPHFSACTKAGLSASRAPAEIVRDPCAAILLCLDAAGKIKGRVVFRLFEGKVYLTRAYGVMTLEHARLLFARLGLTVEFVLEDASRMFHPSKNLPGRPSRKTTLLSRKVRRGWFI